MSKSKFDGSTEWYLGLDVGTNSVGWAATDTEYNVLKFNGNATWGIYLFDEAKTAESRRINRTARRRLVRKKQRISMLQEFFAKEIAKVDPQFFVRLKESALWSEDRSTGGETHLFVGNGLSDKAYNQQYPTIHHLICELIDNPEYHDPRLVYMACSYILSHRGHFLVDVSEDNVDKVVDFENVYCEFLSWFESMEIDIPWNCSTETFRSILIRKIGVSGKEKLFYQDVMGGARPKDIDSNESMPISLKSLISLICGRKTKVSDLFKNEEYAGIENSSISISSSTFDDELETLSTSIDDTEYDLLFKIKKLYDWSVLVDILNGEKMISKAKVNTYEQHKNDLEFLKYLIRTYAPDKYDKVFRECGKEKNYASYSYNCKNLRGKSIPADYKMATAEEFCKFVSGIVAPLEKEIAFEDSEQFTEMMNRLANNSFCPKQMTSDNRVIPYQLYYYELELILSNASNYLNFLNDNDSYGTVGDKILSIMRFRIPYYVGPLNNYRSNNAWMVRKEDGPIYPWNFEEKVDLDKSENEFIRRMTGKCTYIRGEEVLPKNSLLYEKFEVLNEINNLRVNDMKISVDAKQGIYESLFMKRRKVTVKAIKNFLISNCYMKEDDTISGVDDNIKSSLKAYHDFGKYLRDGKLNESDVETIIYRITLTTDRTRLRKWLASEFDLSNDDIKAISKLKYSDFGRLSERLLTSVFDVDINTGVQRREENIIQMLWNTNENFMMLMSSDYGYYSYVNIINEEYECNNPRSLDDRLNDMYISNSVKRPILRTIDIVEELVKIFKCEPKKIFVEMARGAREDQKGRTKSRRDQLKDLYANFDKNEVTELLTQLDSKTDDELRSEKLFLYFCQLGKCMYSGKPINISEIGNQKMYDVDHIWPQSKIKDDSLDNKVLVLSTLNGEKGDKYPINEEWRRKMYSTWASLHDKRLISDKKFDRLTRVTTFTDDELAQFINRQLVETRQSTKAIAEVLGKSMPNSEIVYVKAGLASNFRHEFKDDYHTLKCREVNDLHHAKDAYLNIVMGNIYDVKFTKNPINFIKSGANYTLNLKPMLNHDIERNGLVAWRAKDDVWFNRVINTIHKNNIRFVRFSYQQHGKLFKVSPLRKGKGQVELKRGMSIDKYGGYNDQTIVGYYLISHDGKKEKEISLLPVPLWISNTISNMTDIIDYCENAGMKNPKVLLNGRLIKINSLWEIDGYRAYLSGKFNDYILFRSGQQLILSPELEVYVKKIYKYCNKISQVKHEVLIMDYDGLNSITNMQLYDLLLHKLSNTSYKVLMTNSSKTIVDGRDIFCNLSCESQVIALSNIIKLFDSNDSQGKDLSLIGGVKHSGIQYISKKLDSKKFKDIRLIDQSCTGLFENKTANLIEL